MALPTTTFKQSSGVNTFLYPDNLSYTNFTRYEMGGVALSDGSQGLLVAPWSSRYDPTTGGIYLKNMTTEVESLIISVMDCVRIDFAFDANMRPSIAYQLSDGTVRFRWYDSVPEDYTTTTLPAGARNPILTHDDKRRIGQQANYSDVIIFYINASNQIIAMYQRDRYTVNYQIATVSPGTILDHGGMCTDNRIRLVLKNGSFISSP